MLSAKRAVASCTPIGTPSASPVETATSAVFDDASDFARSLSGVKRTWVGALQLILEQELGRNRFFGGRQWDMSDFMVACVLYVLTRLNFDLTAYPKLEAWLLGSINRPAAQSARKLRET